MVSTGYVALISRWFARYLKKLGIRERDRDFHTFSI
tara:strand:+ start:1098 stop:1205 length:108 start_codon:yes stop_codon:yes gene_type:complete